MIPRAYITEWRNSAPWVSDVQVEQDLIIARVIATIFSTEILPDALAFRGGTALYKLYITPPRRYSEDIDLVQIHPGPAGDILDKIQTVLNPFLGNPKRKRAEDSITLLYRMESEGPPVLPLRLKIEINTREHFAVNGYRRLPFQVSSRWFTGRCLVTTFTLEELLATKMRALYQRRKGRDMFDLWMGLTGGNADPPTIVSCFEQYMNAEGNSIDRDEYSKNLHDKIKHKGFLSDVDPLLAAGTNYSVLQAYVLVNDELVERLGKTKTTRSKRKR